MRFILATLIIFAVLCAGCVKPPDDTGTAGGSGGTTAGAGGDQPAELPAEYRWPLHADAPTLDPIQITDTVSDTVAKRIFSTLVKFATDGTVINDLAEDWWISEDGLEYHFKLREGVTFHNGEPLTAHDVAYSYTRLVDSEQPTKRHSLMTYVNGAMEFYAGEVDQVRGIIVEDDHNIVLTLSGPYAPFIQVLCMANFCVVPESVVEDDPEGFGAHPIGSGPFMFDSWERGERITLVANPDYFKGAPKLERVTFMVFEDEKTRFENFKAGALEHCDIPPSQIQEVRGDPALNALVQGEPAMDMYCYGFNCEQPPFKDNTALRRALNYAVDKQNIIDNIWGGLVSLQQTFVPEGMFYFWDDSPGYPYDPEKAAQLLEQAGYPGGEGLEELVLNIDTPLTNKLVAQAVQEDLRQIGVTVRIEVTDWGSFLPKVYAGESLFFQNTWLGDYPDPDTWLYQLLHSDNFGELGNITRWGNSQFDRLVGMAQVEQDQARRAELYLNAEKLAYDEAPWLMLFWKNSATLVQPYVRGLEIARMDRTPQLNNAPLEQVWFEEP